ncbi:MAG: hypothetical protein K2K56_01175 [Lachnospiraceae bacterium]|nr:hypothetical protein [Lachnospiraceae bacterium]
MMEQDTLVVDGFVFPSYKEAQIAIKEQKNIEVIRTQTADSDGEAMYELYVKLLERNMFKTVVGFSYLYELRRLLTDELGYDEQKLPRVALPKRMEYDTVSEINQGVLESKVQQLMLIKKRMTIVITALIFMVVAMFVIAAINPNVGYINTENKIINKYEVWQQELEQREKAVQEKEAELGIQK